LLNFNPWIPMDTSAHADFSRGRTMRRRERKKRQRPVHSRDCLNEPIAFLNNPNRSGSTDSKRSLTSLGKNGAEQSVMTRYVFVILVCAIDSEKTGELFEFYGKSLITAPR
jgi:hypothetical protein